MVDNEGGRVCGGESEGRNHIQYEVSVQLSAFVCMNHFFIQAIPGNDQNASPTNKKTAGSNLDRTS